jgi:ABC-2 type transport system permease protein
VTAPQIIAAQARNTDRSRAVRARDVLSFEWTKLRSVRSNYWTLLIAAVVSVGVTVIVAHSISSAPAGRAGVSPANSLSPLTSSFLGYAEYAILPAAIIGVLAFTSEFSTGLIRTTLVAVPRRRAVLAAKAAVVGTIALLAGELLAFVSFFLTQAILTGHHGGLSFSGHAGAVLAAGVLMPACVLAGLGLGAIIRHTAGAIAATVAVIYLVPAACLFLPSPWRDDLGRFTLGFAAYQVTAPHPQPGLLSPALSMLVILSWPAASLLAAALVLVRLDV